MLKSPRARRTPKERGAAGDTRASREFGCADKSPPLKKELERPREEKQL